MVFSRLFVLVFCIYSIGFFLCNEARRHHHEKHKHNHSHKISQISEPPTLPPQPDSYHDHIAQPPSTVKPPPPPSTFEPSSPPEDEDDYNPTAAPSPSPEPSNVFDVRKFGAVGDGVTDDTEAFKMAWDSACPENSSVILIPYGFSFMIQSTIFTGPCQGGLVFQVSYFIAYFFCLYKFLRKTKKVLIEFGDGVLG